MNISKILKNLAICCYCLIITKSNSVYSTDDKAIHEVDKVVKNDVTFSSSKQNEISREIDNIIENDVELPFPEHCGTLHKIDKKVFQHNVDIVNPNGCCEYEFYVPAKKCYILSNDKLQYCGDRFNQNSEIDFQSGKFYRISNTTDQSEYDMDKCATFSSPLVDFPIVVPNMYSYVDAKQLIYYQNSNYNTKSKFNQLYHEKIDNNLLDDVITNLNKNIKSIFGKNYSLCENWRYDLDRKDRTVTLKDTDGI